MSKLAQRLVILGLVGTTLLLAGHIAPVADPAALDPVSTATTMFKMGLSYVAFLCVLLAFDLSTPPRVANQD